jgi:hypothetical protein
VAAVPTTARPLVSLSLEPSHRGLRFALLLLDEGDDRCGYDIMGSIVLGGRNNIDQFGRYMVGQNLSNPRCNSGMTREDEVAVPPGEHELAQNRSTH